MLHHNIKRLREAKGWTQKTLAKKVGVERTGITRYESIDGYYPKPPTLRALARALGTTVNNLLFNDGDNRYSQKKRNFYSIIDTVADKRREMGLKRIDLARISGVSSSCIGDYENHKLAQLDNLLKLTEAVGLEIIVREKQ